jgi:hypothetical protein
MLYHSYIIIHNKNNFLIVFMFLFYIFDLKWMIIPSLVR